MYNPFQNRFNWLPYFIRHKNKCSENKTTTITRTIFDMTDIFDIFDNFDKTYFDMM